MPHCVARRFIGVISRGVSQRRVCPVPKFVEEAAVDELVDGLRSPVSIRINSSSDITVSIVLPFYKIPLSH